MSSSFFFPGQEPRARSGVAGSMGQKLAHFLAIAFTAAAMVPGGAHLFAMAAKMGMAQEPYFTVQQIYRGWALFGIAIVGAVLANAAVAWMVRNEAASFRLALAATLMLVGTLVVFFIWTYPANQATQDWTLAPPNWDDLRVQWEYSHAANAVMTFAALCCAVLSELATRE